MFNVVSILSTNNDTIWTPQNQLLSLIWTRNSHQYRKRLAFYRSGESQFHIFQVNGRVRMWRGAYIAMDEAYQQILGKWQLHNGAGCLLLEASKTNRETGIFLDSCALNKVHVPDHFRILVVIVSSGKLKWHETSSKYSTGIRVHQI